MVKRTKAQRSAAARKAVRTRKRNAAEKAKKQPPERESVQLVKNLQEKQKEDLVDDNSPLF